MQNMATLQTTEHLNEAARWKAVMDRDRGADGIFVYAVHSTGVYCRPSCPSRRPRRDRVSFFDTIADAKRGGFRACKRCTPDSVAAVDPWIEKVRRATVYLANVDGHPSLARWRRASAAARITFSGTSSGSSASRRGSTPRRAA